MIYIINTIGNLIYGDEYINIPNKTLEQNIIKSPLGISLFGKINQKERNLNSNQYKDYSGLSISACK